MKPTVTTLLFLAFVFFSSASQAQLSGTYNVGSGQDFTSLEDAFNTLMADGSSGDVTFLITEDLSESANVVLGFDPGAENTITIKPAPSATPVVTFLGTSDNSIYNGALIIGLPEPDGGGGALTFTRNIIFDGSNSENGSSRDITFQTDSGALDSNIFRIIGDTDNIQFRNINFEVNQPGNPFNTFQITSRADALHNDIQFVNNSFTNLNANSARVIMTDGIVSAENGPNLTIEDNDIVTRRYGIWLREVGGNTTIRGNTISIEHTGNFFAYGVLVDEVAESDAEIIIEDNIFQNSFSPNTMVGIRGSAAANYVIDGNTFQGLGSGDGITRPVWVDSEGSYTITNNLFTQISGDSEVRLAEVRNFTGDITISDNTFSDVSVTGDLTAILASSAAGYTISGNTFESLSSGGLLTALNVQSHGSYQVESNEFFNLNGDGGIEVVSFSSEIDEDYDATFVNNMMTGFSSGGDGEALYGIILRSPSAPAEASLTLHHNTFRLNPLDVSGSGWNYRALFLFSNPRISAELRNNIFINEDDNGSNVTSYAYYQAGSAAASFDSDYNLWFVAHPETSSTWLSRHGGEGTNTTELSGHQTSTGDEANSVSTSAEFVSGDDLRLTGSSLGDQNLAGIPLATVLVDIDGTPRDNENPYMGAFEGPSLSANDRDVTFSVDMNVQAALGFFDTELGDEVYLRGDFNDFEPTDVMSESAPGIYELTIAIDGQAGESVDYKFFILAGDGRTLPNDGWELLDESDPLLNRSFTLGAIGEPQVLDTVFFNDNDEFPEDDVVTVWPGDANNDGVVNEQDVLSLGTYWAETGPQRDDASIDWTGQQAEPWNPEEATFADTNGDGQVDQSDLLAIGVNFGETHGTVLLDENPLFTTPLPVLNSGESVRVEINPSVTADLQGLSYSFSVIGASDADFAISDISTGSWADDWNNSSSLINFTREEDNSVSGAHAHKGFTNTVSADTFVEFTITAESFMSGTELVIDRLVIVDENGSQINWADIDVNMETEAGTSAGTDELPQKTALHQNYPNPFNPVTQIVFDLSQPSDVTIEVMNILGQRVAMLANQESMSAGSHVRTFDASRLTSGVYLVRMSAGSEQFTRKMMLVK